MAFKLPRGKGAERADARSSIPQTQSEISKLVKENAYLKKMICELRTRPSGSEDNKLLLERILALETLGEENSQQIRSRDQEIASLRQQLEHDSPEVVARLQAQLEEKRRESEKTERLLQSLRQETEEVKNKLVAVSAKWQDLENREAAVKSGTADGRTTTRDLTVIQEHLKDALEKNQQWLAYDQQREAYVKAVLERTYHLEQELKQANEALQERDEGASSEVNQAVEAQQRYEELLRLAQTKLEAEREQVTQGRMLLSHLQQECEERQQEVAEMRQKLQVMRLSGKKELQEERRRSGERIEHLAAKLDGVRGRLEEERLRSSELTEQVNLLQKSLLNQHEQHDQMAVLEEQIQLSAKDLEDEKRDNQHLQQQLHKILKELRKTKETVARLEREREDPLSEHSAYKKEEEAPEESQQRFTSPTGARRLLDESFLECPNCRAQYPTSRHRDLLLHVDQCFD